MILLQQSRGAHRRRSVQVSAHGGDSKLPRIPVICSPPFAAAGEKRALK
jgi:hypothetical protein